MESMNAQDNVRKEVCDEINDVFWGCLGGECVPKIHDWSFNSQEAYKCKMSCLDRARNYGIQHGFTANEAVECIKGKWWD